jgi:hypothetical protein
MDGWTVESVIYVGCLIFAGLCLAWAVTFGLRALLNENTAPFKQADNSPIPPTRGVVRRCPRVVLGDPRLLSATLAPRSGS